jgi:hypothetical protein
MDRNSDVKNEEEMGTETAEKGGTKIINLTLMDRNSDGSERNCPSVAEDR